MRVSEIDITYVKEQLSIPDDYETDRRLTTHISSAIDYVKKTHGYTTILEMDEEEFLVELVMFVIEQLYDNGGIINYDPIKYMSIDRRF